MAGRQQLVLAVTAAPPHRADGVDHVPRGKLPRAGRLRVSGLAAAEPPALREDRRAARAMDRTVDAAAAEQRGVRRVDDRVDALRGDVAFDEADAVARGHQPER